MYFPQIEKTNLTSRETKDFQIEGGGGEILQVNVHPWFYKNSKIAGVCQTFSAHSPP